MRYAATPRGTQHGADGRARRAEHADPQELQRLASAAEAADAKHELPAGAAADAARRAWTDEELAVKRGKVKEVRPLLPRAAL